MSEPLKVKNFMFHRVNPVRDKLWDPMDVAHFDRTVKYLSKQYQVLPLEEVCAQKENKLAGGKKPVATISFDDGYHDNLEFAAPILKKYNCKASFYIVTDCVDAGHMIWTQEIKHFLQHTSLLRFNADLSYLPEKLQVRAWNTVNERMAFATTIRNFLVKSNQRVRDYFITDIRAAFTDVELPRNVMMSWDDVRQLRTEGHIIGSHTKTHPALPSLERISEIENELRQSGQRIEAELGAFPTSIAYPFGAYDDDVVAATRRTGYKMGITVNQSWHYPAKDSSFTISRTGLVNEVWPKTLLRMNGGFELLRKLINRQPHHWRPVTGNLILSASYLATDALEMGG